LELIDDSIRFDGFNCFRYADVTSCGIPAPNADFVTKALKAQGLCRQEAIVPDLSTLTSLLSSASVDFPLSTIHVEDSEPPDICFIGKVESLKDDRLELKLVTPNAKWEEDTKHIALSDITRVDFGGAYEKALFLVAGSS